ncbi:MAG: uncharacterized protein JWN44_1528 [Myxococcales bacterium]|nr:uncharacterized protein [Myxococcales bacterium]
MKRALLAAALAVVAIALVLFVVLSRRGAHPTQPANGAGGAPTTPPPPGTTPPATTPPAHGDLGASSARARVILSAPWGSAAGQLGHRADPESVTEGPMSFFVDGHGVLVLDNVNKRLARFDAAGRPRTPIALDTEAAQDVARGVHDRIAVLDRLRDKRVSIYDADGRALNQVPLAGTGLAEPAAVSGLFSDDKGNLWAERAHGAWLRLADATGAIDHARPSAPGRPTRDGRFVAAAISDRTAGRAKVRVYADGENPPVWETTVDFAAPLMFLALLDADAAGEVFVAAHTGHESKTPPFRIEDESLTLVKLGRDGAIAGRMTVPAAPPREEAFRDLYVGDDGTVYWMRRTVAGVVIEAYRL